MTNTPIAPPVPEPTPQNQLPIQTPQEVIVVNEQSDARNRERIALSVLIISIVAVTLVSLGVVLTANNRERASQRVMDSTLPLYGTWVGTILAFYFSRNAFEAASSAAARNVDVFQRVNSGLVSAPPPPNNTLAKISLKSLANGLVFCEDNTNKLLQDVINELELKDRYRIIVVDADKKYVDLVYRINASAFLTQAEGNPDPSPPGGSPVQPLPTLKNYLDWRHSLGSKAQPIVVFLPESATLADADAKLKETTGCRDVIVTTDGSKTSLVVVYVTDADISEYKRPVAL